MQICKFKGSRSGRARSQVAGVVPRMALRMPLNGSADPLSLLFQHLHCRRRTSSWLLPSASAKQHLSTGNLTDGVRMALSIDNVQPPLGMKFTPRSLRSGGLSAAYSVGVSERTVLRIANHDGDGVLFLHYVDPLTRPTDAARILFARL